MTGRPTGTPIKVTIEAYLYHRAPKPEPGCRNQFIRRSVCCQATEEAVAEAAWHAVSEVMRTKHVRRVMYDVGVTVECKTPAGDREWTVTVFADECLAELAREDICASIAFSAREAFDGLPPSAYNYSPVGRT